MRLLYFFLIYMFLIYSLLVIVKMILMTIEPFGDLFFVLSSPLIIMLIICYFIGYGIVVEYIGKKIGVI